MEHEHWWDLLYILLWVMEFANSHPEVHQRRQIPQRGDLPSVLSFHTWFMLLSVALLSNTNVSQMDCKGFDLIKENMATHARISPKATIIKACIVFLFQTTFQLASKHIFYMQRRYKNRWLNYETDCKDFAWVSGRNV